MMLANCGGGSSSADSTSTKADSTSSNAVLTSIAVDPVNPSTPENTEQQYTATGTFSDNTTRDMTSSVTWSSSNPQVTVVSNTGDSMGVATGLATGSATISAAYGDQTGSTSQSVTAATLTSIAVTPTNPTIADGTNKKFVATGTFSDNTTKNISASAIWTSSNSAVATISNTAGSRGRATGASIGTTTISAAYKGQTGATTLTVKAATLASITVTPTNPSIAAGTDQQFMATGIYTDGTSQDLTALATWTSSNPAMATISSAVGSDGLARGVSAGTTTISAAYKNRTGSTTLTVTAATLTTITVTPAQSSLVDGTNQQFTATGIFSNSTTQDLTALVLWTSSGTTVAAISNAAGSKGWVTSLTAGSTTIKAVYGSVSGTTALTVTPATLVSLAITPTNPSIAKGTNQQFTATGTYSDGTTQNLTTAVTWSSSSIGVATISNAAGSKGLATSVTAGLTTIKATSGAVTRTTTLTITAASLVSISVTPANPSLANGATRQFTATGTYSDGTTQNLTTAVTWSSSSAGVAAISNAAGSKGLATGVGSGTTTVKGVSGSISGSTALTVTGNSTLSLTWDAPTQYMDGSSLNPAADLKSYRLYYGTVSQSYTQMIPVANPSTSVITQSVTLAPGTYFFVVTAITQDDLESTYSIEIAKTVY